MKLNIEELARESGIETKLWNMGAASLVYTEGCHGVARSEFEAVIRLVVERCAQECVKERNTWADYSDGYAALLGFEQRLHNLMED